MNEELKEKFKTEVEQADWNMLAPHHEKGAVFILGSSLDLLDVGVALAKDDSDQVKIWLDNKQLLKPSDKQVEDFTKNPYEKFCKFLIIQPFVLVKLMD